MSEIGIQCGMCGHTSDFDFKAIQQFGENALHKAETQKVECPTPQNLDLFAQGSF